MRLLRALSAPLTACVLLAGCSAAPDPYGRLGVDTAPATGAKARAASIELPSIEARSTLLATGLDPADPHSPAVPDVHHPEQASYFALGPMPGDVGPALVLGHVNGDGQQGVFARLYELVPDDRVVVTRTDGSTVAYRVTAKQLVRKNAFPWAQVQAPTRDPELIMVTCGGTLNRQIHSYESNWIIRAVAV